MATLSLVLGNSTAWGSTHGYVQDGGKLPAVARLTTGWIPGTKAAGQSSILQWGTKRASTTFAATLQPDGATAPGTTDCLRTVNSYRGSFAAAAWSFSFALRSATAAYTGRLRLRIRVWKSASQTGTSATEITSGAIVTAATTANLSTTANTVVTASWTPSSTITLNDEYLFFQVGVEVTSAGGGTTQDCLLTTDSANSVITTSTFTPSATAFTRNVITTLPAAPNGIDYVLPGDDASIKTFLQDINPAGSSDIFCIMRTDTVSASAHYYLGVSTDKGVTWSWIAASNAEPNADASNNIQNGISPIQDSTNYKVHWLQYDVNDSNYWYNRIALSYTSGHITGWSWEVERQTAITFNNAGGQPPRLQLEEVVDGNSVKRLMLIGLDNPSATDVACRYLAAITTPAAGLAPTGATSWCKLTDSTATNAFDILGAWSATAVTDPNAFVNYTSFTNLNNSYNNTLSAAQISSNKDLHFFFGGFYYNDQAAAPGPLRRWRMTASGSNFVNDGTVNGAILQNDDGTHRPCLSHAVGRTNAVYCGYIAPGGTCQIDKIASSGTVTANVFSGMEPAVSGALGYIGFNISTDETTCWASLFLGLTTPAPLWRVGYHNGTSWITYDETLDYNNTATGESVPYWQSRNISSGVVVGSYMYADYGTATHHVALHTFASPGGGAAALQGAVTAPATTAGALTTGIPLAAGSSGTATVAGALTTKIVLTAGSTGVATVGGSLTTAINAAGSSIASAVGSGSLTTGIPVAGSTTAGATVTGALTAIISLAGASVGVAVDSGSLTTAINLAAGASAVATGAGSLTTGIPLAAGTSGVATTTGSLTANISLAAGINGNATVAGSLTTAIQAAGTTVAAATAAGALTTGIPLAAGSSGTATATGGLTTAIRLAGASIGSSSAVAQFGPPAAHLTGDIVGTGTVAGALQTSILLQGPVAGAGSASAALVTAIQLAGGSVGVSQLQGGLLTGITLGGDIVAAAQSQGGLSTSIVLGAGSTALSQVQGGLTTAIQLGGASVGTAQLQGSLGSPLMSGSISGSAALTGNLTTAIYLQGAVVGSSVAQLTVTSGGVGDQDPRLMSTPSVSPSSITPVHVYSIGGSSDTNGLYLLKFSYGKMLPDAIRVKTLPEARIRPAIGAYQGWLYIIGGVDANGTVRNQLWRARILPGGMIDKIIDEGPCPCAWVGAGIAFENQMVTVFGPNLAIGRAQVASDGRLNNWVVDYVEI